MIKTGWAHGARRLYARRCRCRCRSRSPMKAQRPESASDRWIDIPDRRLLAQLQNCSRRN
jgi:hypothetical protein